MPWFQSDEEAISMAQQLLIQIGSNPILLILDDVWSGSELLLEMFYMPNLNILVTSRTILSGFSFIYNLQPLNDEDAMTLFCHSAFPQDEINIPLEIIKKVLPQSVKFIWMKCSLFYLYFWPWVRYVYERRNKF